MLGLSVNTRAISPSFPLLFHEKFRFHKMLRSVNSLAALQELLKIRNLQLQLLHTSTSTHSCGSTTVIATFRSPVADVFYPTPSSHGLNAGTDVDLLLKPTACFPGIISPKAEISTRVVIEEVVNYCSPERVINPVTISSKAEFNHEEVTPISRQRAVCHTECCQCCDCYKSKKTTTSQQPPFLMGRLPRRPSFKPKQQKRFSRNRNQSKPVDCKKEENDIPHISCNCQTPDEDSSTVCRCILCKKYKDYFPPMDSSSDFENNSKISKQKKCNCCPNQDEIRKERKSRGPDNCPLISHKDLKRQCSDCKPHHRSITVLKSAVPARDERGDCSCGIYSCSEWQAEKQREEISRSPPLKETYKDGRQLFFADLEDFYRQLYSRSKLLSSLSRINAYA